MTHTRQPYKMNAIFLPSANTHIKHAPAFRSYGMDIIDAKRPMCLFGAFVQHKWLSVTNYSFVRDAAGFHLHRHVQIGSHAAISRISFHGFVARPQGLALDFDGQQQQSNDPTTPVKRPFILYLISGVCKCLRVCAFRSQNAN